MKKLRSPINLCDPAYIYGLTEPDTDEVRYVGKANNPQSRLSGHIQLSRKGWGRVSCWISRMRGCGRTPGLKILETCTQATWEQAERHWIYKMIAGGANLLNVAEGGAGFDRKRRIAKEWDSREIVATIADRLPEIDEPMAHCLRLVITAEQAWILRKDADRPFPGSVERLIARGLMEQWERWDGKMVTLTPFSAYSLNLKLAEKGSKCTPHWTASTRESWFYPESYPRTSGEISIEDAPEIERMETVVIDEVTDEPMILFQGPSPGTGLRPNGVPVEWEKAKGGARTNKRPSLKRKRKKKQPA